MKKCSTCKQEKPLTEFYTRSQSPDKLHFHCKECSKNKRNKWNSEKGKDYWRHASYVRASSKTGIPVEDIYRAIKSQDFKCKICKSPEKDKFLAVDHCHQTGKFRGMLCQKCNTGLGQFNDDPELLRQAILYLFPELQP